MIPVDAKMYRHFAIATVLITGCLAMFASGENRQAIQDKIEAHQRRAEAQQAEQEAAKSNGIGKKKNFTDKRKVKGSFSSDGDIVTHTVRNEALKNGGYAISNQAELVAGDEVKLIDSRPSNIRQGEYDPDLGAFKGPMPAGMSAEQYAQMMEQAKRKKKKPAVREQMSNKDFNDMVAASKARSQTRTN